MLGQDDNPSQAAEERERARAGPGGRVSPSRRVAETTPLRSAQLPGQKRAAADGDHLGRRDDERDLRVRDRRRGLWLGSAGHRLRALSATVPGEAAWRADLQPGDMFVAIDDSGDRPLRFRDLMSAVALGNIENGIDFKVERQGVEKPFVVHIKPDPNKHRLRPTIGVIPPRTATLSDDKPVVDGTPAAQVEAFEPSDRIVAMGGVAIGSFADLVAQLEHQSNQSIRFTVERTAKGAESPETIEIEVPARPMLTLGLTMKMGKITAVQTDSPAATAGLQADDFIVAVDGQSPADPLRLPDELRRRAGQTVTLTIARESASGQAERLEKQVTLREPRWPEEAEVPGTAVSAPALGVTYQALNIVDQAEKGTPAAEATLLTDGQPASVPLFAAGDEIALRRVRRAEA